MWPAMTLNADLCIAVAGGARSEGDREMRLSGLEIKVLLCL